MSQPEALIGFARQHGVRFGLDGDDLLLLARAEPPAALVEDLRLHKQEIVSWLLAQQEVRLIRRGVDTLCKMPPPGSVRPDRWQVLVRDARRFVDVWAAAAARLGWTAVDLFGCHDSRPDERHDQKGLVWIVEGREVAAMTDAAAIIRDPGSGTRLTFHRRCRASARVAWGLHD